MSTSTRQPTKAQQARQQREALAKQRQADADKAEREAAAAAEAAQQGDDESTPDPVDPVDPDAATDGDEAEGTESEQADDDLPAIGTVVENLPARNTGGGGHSSKYTELLNGTTGDDVLGKWAVIEIASSARMGTVKASKVRSLLHKNGIPGLTDGYQFDVQARGRVIHASAVKGDAGKGGSRLVKEAADKIDEAAKRAAAKK